jgi:uncharacterized protein with GYD domain
MPHYISLIRYTQKDVESLKDSPKRIDATKTAFEAAGGKLRSIGLLGSTTRLPSLNSRMMRRV